LHRRRHLAQCAARAYAGAMAHEDCPECGGSGWRVISRDALPRGKSRKVFEADDSAGSASGAPQVVERVAVPCICVAEDRTAQKIRRARIPVRYRDCNFESFETDNEYADLDAVACAPYQRSLQQAKVVMQGFARDFPLSVHHGLLLIGPCGVGKTHLAVAALYEIVLRGHSGLFYDYRELLKEIQDSYNPESQSTEMSVLEPVLKTDLLLLDDLGSSKPSLWALETVGHILSSRYNDNRLTLLTTNFLDAEPAPSSGDRAFLQSSGSRLSSLEDSLSDRIGKRIRSRLFEMCRTVEIDAPDYRKFIRCAGG
jgi:DNA replication protein DnaC